MEKGERKGRVYQETTLKRLMDIINAYDKVVANSPKEWRKGISKNEFYNKTEEELGYRFSVSYIRLIVIDRQNITKQFKEAFGENA